MFLHYALYWEFLYYTQAAIEEANMVPADSEKQRMVDHSLEIKKHMHLLKRCTLSLERTKYRSTHSVKQIALHNQGFFIHASTIVEVVLLTESDAHIEMIFPFFRLGGLRNCHMKSSFTITSPSPTNFLLLSSVGKGARQFISPCQTWHARI